MKSVLVWTGRILEPADDQELAILRSGYGPGELVEVDVKKARNLKHHRKFMAMIGEAFKQGCTIHGNRFHNMDAMRIYIEICIGWCDYYDFGPMRVPVARSINFDSVDQVEFVPIYSNAVLFMAEELEPPCESVTSEADELIAKGINRTQLRDAA